MMMAIGCGHMWWTLLIGGCVPKQGGGHSEMGRRMSTYDRHKSCAAAQEWYPQGRIISSVQPQSKRKKTEGPHFSECLLELKI